jgi:hypothetical protein
MTTSLNRLPSPGRIVALLRRAGLVLPLLAGCGHGEPFSSRYLPEDGPIGSLQPRQLTRSPGEDQFPSWSPDGSALLYSFVDPVTMDRCVGQMPGGGGQVVVFRCPTDDRANDSLDQAIEPMMRGDGSVAWVHLHSARERQIHDGGSLYLGSLDGTRPPRRLWHFPYLAPTGSVHFGATNLRWMPGDRLLYIGIDYLIRAVCFGCKPDTVVISREVMLLDASQPSPSPAPIAGTAEATSIWPTADSTGFYFTRAGDARVWQRPLDGGGLPTLVHDFVSGGIVRDVSVVGQRLAAVVGGKVSYGFEESIGLRQLDSGGVLTMVDLSTSAATQIDTLLYRRPVLSPDGRRLVAERITRPSTHPDLWLFELP